MVQVIIIVELTSAYLYDSTFCVCISYCHVIVVITDYNGTVYIVIMII